MAMTFFQNNFPLSHALKNPISSFFPNKTSQKLSLYCMASTEHFLKKKKISYPFSGTPAKLTPGKKHHILAPETPVAKNGRRKSDGTQVVDESPDIDAVKQGKTTPRRINASLALRRKTSFYSGHASRNLMAAEEEMHVKKLQNGFNTSLPIMPDNAGDKTTSRILFPFLEDQSRPQ